MLIYQNKEIDNLTLNSLPIHRVYLGEPYNLLQQSEHILLKAQNSTHNFAKCSFSSPMQVSVGDKLSISVGDIEVLAGNPQEFTIALYNSDVTVYFGRAHLTKTQKHATIISEKNGTISLLLLYAGKIGETNNISVQYNNVMCIKGNIPAPYWTPSITDATIDGCIIYKKPPTYNLLLNSDFKNGFDNWLPGISMGGVSIDNKITLDGRNSLKCVHSSLTDNYYAGLLQYVDANPGDDFTVSLWMYSTDISTIDGGTPLEIGAQDSANKYLSTANVWSKIQANNTWQFVMGTIKNCPVGTAKLRIRFGTQKNGTVWFNGIKVERGINVAPEWSPHASETENLLLGTKNIDLLYWSWNYKGNWEISKEIYNGCTVYQQTVTQGDYWCGWYYKPDFEITEDCTFSLWVRLSNGTCKAKTIIAIPRRDYENIPITTEWKRIYVYLKAGDKLKQVDSNKGIFEFYNFTEASTIYVSGFKLERERNPNPVWTPNPSEN